MTETKTRRPRVAIYSPFYYPELISTGKVNTLMGNEVRNLGWDVDVICSHPLYPNWKPEVTNAGLAGTRFFRGGAKLKYPANAVLRRALLELWFTLHAVVATYKIRRDLDVAVMVYPPSLFAIFVNALLPRHVRKVDVVHDLQGVYAQQGYVSGFRLLTRLIHAVESRAFEYSDCCIFFSEDMARTAQESYGLDASKISVQYPFITIDPDAPLTNELEQIMPSDRQHVVYSGALGEKQNPEQLVEFLAAAAELEPSAQFHVFSAGPKFDKLREMYEGKSGVSFHALIPEEQLAELYARSSVQLLPQAVGTENGSLPSKLPNLLVSGVQILAICSEASEVSVLLKRTSAATLVPHWEKTAFLSAMQEALLASGTVSHAVRRAGSAHLFPQFQVSRLAHLLVDPARSPQGG